MKYFRYLGSFLVIVLIAACATGTTRVMAPPSANMAFTSASIESGEHTVVVDADASARYESKLNELLFEEGVFAEGSGLTIRYRFIQFDRGSQAMRYMIGMGVGKGSLTIETVFLDQDGSELARIESASEISAGVFGGSFDEAVDKAATQTAEYAQTHFTNLPPSS